MLRRQQRIRTAAEHVASARARLPQVQKVVLIGFVAIPLKKD